MSDNTSKCQTCAGRDPYRESDVVMVSGPGPTKAVRMREAWRAFWRYRGEEISAAWGWLPEPMRLAVGALGVVACIAMVIMVGALWLDHDCAKKCAMTGNEGVSDGGWCYCIDDGSPVTWRQVGER